MEYLIRQQFFLIFFIFNLFDASVLLGQASSNYDIVIYGGSSAGVAAAIQSSRMGKSVVLIEPSEHLGGLTTGGLGATD
ncbi:MAG TPA: FAD-dependent oxidoreductase, partial [Cyclobacteriaceae bacterium]|nr:FAD-dependent oxidoreductase [Cyclobacteriaceae bacterium]